MSSTNENTLSRMTGYIHSIASKVKRPRDFIKTRRAVQKYKKLAPLKRNPRVDIAVVLHLYYVDSWALFREKLSSLRTTLPFDLVITMPAHNSAFAKEILQDFPGAYIYEVPNQGRDVLPFMQVMPLLYAAEYKYLLKMHSKKSTHRKDGNKWFNDMLNSLLPNNKDSLQKLIQTLKINSTGVIGPEGQYVSLRVNFEANGAHMTKIVSKIFNKKIAREALQEKRSEYGFFGGTMFWARTDALTPIIKAKFKISNFETEKGQIDGTFAHAIERILCIIPEIDGRDIYEVGPTGIKKIDYGSGAIPDWADVYIGPKPKKG